MNIHEAARILRNMYNNAPYGEKTTAIHLFGIKYAREISSLNRQDIVREAGISSSYDTEVYKGVRLARYVTLIEDLPRWIQSAHV